jgi:hypothetical protein
MHIEVSMDISELQQQQQPRPTIAKPVSPPPSSTTHRKRNSLLLPVNKCSLCHDRTATGVTDRCGHAVVCAVCAASQPSIVASLNYKCPLCREQLSSILSTPSSSRRSTGCSTTPANIDSPGRERSSSFSYELESFGDVVVLATTSLVLPNDVDDNDNDNDKTTRSA